MLSARRARFLANPSVTFASLQMRWCTATPSEGNVPEPLAVDRQPFRHNFLRALLMREQPKYASPIWISDRQARAMTLNFKPSAAPVSVPVPGRSQVLNFFNADQLTNPAILDKQTPEYVDGEACFGVEAFALRKRRHAFESNQWFTYPTGLINAGRELSKLLPKDAKPFRRDVYMEGDRPVARILVNGTFTHRMCEEQILARHEVVTPHEMTEAEAILESLEEGDPLPSRTDGVVIEEESAVTATAAQLAIPVVHVDSSGVPFFNRHQARLDTYMKRGNLTSCIWYDYHADLPTTGAAIQVTLTNKDHSTRVVVNADHVDTNRVIDGAKRHLSGKTLLPFRHQSEFEKTAVDRNFKSKIWWTPRLVAEHGMVVKQGQVPLTQKMGYGGKRIVEFFNEDQLDNVPTRP